MPHPSLVSVNDRNDDEAIEFCTTELGFDLIEDTRFRETKRSGPTSSVTFLERSRGESYDCVAVFKDFCCNRWDLVQRKL